MKILNSLAKILMNRKCPRYSKLLFKFCSKYVDFCYGDNDFDRNTNGEYYVLKKIIPRSKVVFDIGANIGDYSLEVKRLNQDVSIHAFEPDQRAFDKLVEKKVGKVNNIALGEKTGEVILNLHQHKTVFNSILDLHSGSELASKITVKVDTIDNYCTSRAIPHIDFMKIDVEGYEFFVLKGAIKMFEKKVIDFIQFEFSGATAISKVFLKDFIDFFDKYGYSLYRIKPLSIEEIKYYPDQERFTLTNYIAIKNGLNIDFLKVTKPFYHV